MRQLRTYGSARGAGGNLRSYRNVYPCPYWGKAIFFLKLGSAKAFGACCKPGALCCKMNRWPHWHPQANAE